MLVVHVSVCLYVLQSMVQVETLGELGVFFTLFVVGLEFSPERLRKVNKDENCTIISIFKTLHEK